MKRILIIGTSGSGKTTLAKRLTNILTITAFDTDEYYWNPGWQPVNEKNYMEAICSIIANESWIISGNFSNLQHPIWQRYDTIIWLDYSLLRCIYRALTRSLKRMITGQSCCNGNYENLCQLLFSKNSILLWVFKSYNK